MVINTCEWVSSRKDLVNNMRYNKIISISMLNALTTRLDKYIYWFYN